MAFSLTGWAANYFSFTPPAKTAYQKALSLQFEEARSILAQIKIQDPDNLIVYHIENYIDFFTIIINEDEEEFKRLEKNKDYRLDKIRQGDKSSPYYLYSQAEIRLQWAMARLKFEEYFTAFTEVSKAYKQLTQNQELFPDFVANKKSLGILHAAIGTVPDSYRWGIKLLGGMEGSIERGRQEIQEVLDYAHRQPFIFEEETLVLYAFLMLHLKNETDEAWDILHKSKLDPATNPMACFVLANIAMRTGRNDEAIHLLQNRPQGESFHQFYYLDYMLGLAKLKRLDPDAHIFLERYLRKFKGKNYIKEAYQKLAWHYLLQGDEAAYHRYIRSCLHFGAAQIDGDKNALREAETGEIPQVDLLRGRLLFDGGYYHRAYRLLITKSVSGFTQKKHQLEFTYRLGRILHEMKNLTDALSYYQATIDRGQSEPYYYACNSALQIGIIYESQHQTDKAREYYNLCLNMKPDQYRNGLHQKAKAGLDRLKGLKG